MVSPQNDGLVDGARLPLDVERSPFPEPHHLARRLSHTPCPECGSMTVRSRDRRDMCLICGYLQSHT
jgi:ribosomal protein S27AE